MHTRLTTLAIAFVAFAAVPSQAVPLQTPQGPVLLTVTGNIAHTNATGRAEFDRAMLDALPQHTTTATTPWYDTAQSFTGPEALALLELVGASGTTVTVTALNDYSADIPFADFENYRIILANQIGGQPLSVRDKGPSFVIYPFDQDAELYNEVIFGRSVWQVTSIAVK